MTHIFWGHVRGVEGLRRCVCKNIIGPQGHIDVTGVFVDVQMDIRRKLIAFGDKSAQHQRRGERGGLL